jgi:hypothetical protein
MLPTTPPPVTIDQLHACDRWCPHCQAVTCQIGPEGNTCLQCVADGGTCCSLSVFSRWKTPQVRPKRPPRRVMVV